MASKARTWLVTARTYETEGGDSNPLGASAPSRAGTRGNPCRTRAFLLAVTLEDEVRKRPFAAPSGRETCTEGAEPIGRGVYRNLERRRGTWPGRPAQRPARPPRPRSAAALTRPPAPARS